MDVFTNRKIACVITVSLKTGFEAHHDHLNWMLQNHGDILVFWIENDSWNTETLWISENDGYWWILCPITSIDCDEISWLSLPNPAVFTFSQADKDLWLILSMSSMSKSSDFPSWTLQIETRVIGLWLHRIEWKYVYIVYHVYNNVYIYICNMYAICMQMRNYSCIYVCTYIHTYTSTLRVIYLSMNGSKSTASHQFKLHQATYSVVEELSMLKSVWSMIKKGILHYLGDINQLRMFINVHKSILVCLISYEIRWFGNLSSVWSTCGGTAERI